MSKLIVKAIPEKTLIVEVTRGNGWYTNSVGQRFVVTIDNKPSHGSAPYRVQEESALLWDIEQRVSLLVTRYVGRDDAKVIED